MPVFEHRSVVPASADDVFRYHAAPRAFQRLTPPWDHAEVISPLQRLADGEKATFAVAVGPLLVRWVARHEHVVAHGPPGTVLGFDDVMEQGPASSWRHEHRFEPLTDASCTLVDRITWTAPPGGGLVVGPKLERMFAYRHAITSADLQRAHDFKTDRPLTVGITGASGLIGTELHSLLSVLGHTVVPMVRVAAGARAPDGSVGWTPATGTIDPAAVDAVGGLDAVVHLAGENIADGRFDADKLSRLRRQRIDQTRLLWAALQALPRPPQVVVGAAAVGFYGERGDEILDERSPRGTGLLSDFCADWEDAITTAPPSATWRAVAVRIGIVLSPAGGALGKVLPLFKLGLGGPLGDGHAWMPAIAVDDMADIIVRAVVDARLAGVVNAVGPTPVRNRDYTRAVGRAVHRPAFFPVPRMGLRLVLGDLADHILESMRVRPARLVSLGHRFRHDDVDHALRHLLGDVG
jgi:uncharacterized protein (TIGR01777 family)